MLTWNETSLGDSCELYQPKTLTTADLLDDGKYLVYGANGVIGRYDKYNHEDAEILITCRGATCGTVNVSEPKSWINGNAMVVRPRNRELDSRFLQHLLRGGVDLSVAITGAAQPQITRQSLAPIRFKYPPLSEQRRIAAILDKADALRAKRGEALARLDSLAQSIFVEMFGDPAHADVAVNHQQLNNYLSFLTSGGRGWAEYYSESGSRFVRSFDVQMNRIRTNDKVFVTPPQNAEAKRTRVSCGDVLLTITGSLIGRVATAPTELDGAYISQHVAILRLSKEVLEPDFLSYFLSLETGGQRQIAKSQYGQTKPGLNFEQIRAFRVPVPSMERQRQFLTRIRKIDELRRKGLSALEEVECLFSSLQYRAFCGEL